MSLNVQQQKITKSKGDKDEVSPRVSDPATLQTETQQTAPIFISNALNFHKRRTKHNIMMTEPIEVIRNVPTKLWITKEEDSPGMPIISQEYDDEE